MSTDKKSPGLDLAGIGKVAEAIPDEVYTRSTETVLATFEKVTAPLTEFTAGFGRYLRQKFDNMVAAEKALATYSIEKAVHRTRLRAEKAGIEIHPPRHVKSFVTAMEHAAKEADPELHELWVNLLATEISDGISHPHFVEILSHFSSAEAHLLRSLFSVDEVGETGGGYLAFSYDGFKTWMRRNGAPEEPWDISCLLLCEFNLANVAAPKGSAKGKTILYRTKTGSAFLAAVSDRTVDG